MAKKAGRPGPRDGAGAAGGSSAALRAIRQTKPFRSSAQEASISVLVAAERLRRRMTLVVESHGVTRQQYNVLRILRGAHPESLATLEIGARMIESTPGVTRLLDRLEEKDLVARARCRSDRRQVLCRITPAGLALLAEMDDPVDRVDELLDDVLDADEMRELVAYLDRIIESIPPID